MAKWFLEGLVLVRSHFIQYLLRRSAKWCCRLKLVLNLFETVAHSVIFIQGSTSVALYGLGNIRDERLNRMFQVFSEQASKHSMHPFMFFYMYAQGHLCVVGAWVCIYLVHILINDPLVGQNIVDNRHHMPYNGCDLKVKKNAPFHHGLTSWCFTKIGRLCFSFGFWKVEGVIV